MTIHSRPATPDHPIALTDPDPRVPPLARALLLRAADLLGPDGARFGTVWKATKGLYSEICHLEDPDATHYSAEGAMLLAGLQTLPYDRRGKWATILAERAIKAALRRTDDDGFTIREWGDHEIRHGRHVVQAYRTAADLITDPE